MYKNDNSSWTKHIDFMLLDLLGIQIAYIFSYILRHGSESNPYNSGVYLRMGIMLMLIDICVVFLDQSYTGILRRGYLKEFKAVVRHVSSIFVASLLYLFVAKESTIFSRIVLFETWIFAIILLYIARLLWKKYIQKSRRAKEKLRSMILVTTTSIAEETLAIMQKNQYADYKVTGVILWDRNGVGEQVGGIPVIANAKDALEYIRINVVDEVFVQISRDEELDETFLNGCAAMGVTVHLCLNKLVNAVGEKRVEQVAGHTVLTSCIRIAGPRQLLIKRTMDICGSIVGLVATGLIFIIFAPIIYIQSPGPIFFSQTRVGRSGRKFKLYKFRSMYMDAEERKKELMKQNKMKGFMFKMDNDPRIFPIGNFMRNTSLDEFPQMWNVLKGEMSLVGTRPPTVDEYEQYDIHHKKRLATKPGVTGLWQVSGRSDITDFEDVVALDTKYISEWTLALDFRILLKTVQVVFMRKGSI